MMHRARNSGRSYFWPRAAFVGGFLGFAVCALLDQATDTAPQLVIIGSFAMLAVSHLYLIHRYGGFKAVMDDGMRLGLWYGAWVEDPAPDDAVPAPLLGRVLLRILSLAGVIGMALFMLGEIGFGWS